MIFHETSLKDAYLIDLERLEDERGFFARSWCMQEFEKQGLDSRLAQANISFNRYKQTLRGLHYQVHPYEEAKLVRCTRGAIYDVILDLREGSRTYLGWFGVELTADNHRMLYVPKGFAHGFQTLTDKSEASYLMSEFYTPGSGRGVRYDDPAFAIEWPLEVEIISDKDAGWPDYGTK